MSDSNNFSGTITGGIQDISALLPLLGTEQCENHVGAALDRGFLYSSVTPISIFGSLGIVRAAFNILVASLNIQRYRFLGASKLSDGGFTPKGVVAPMIAVDPRNPKRFLAETRLEGMLTEEHIENVEDLTVSWGRRIFLWNLLLIASTLVISLAGLVPYIHIILDSRHISLNLAPFPLGFGFPILRVVGSGLCVTFAQFLIQIRIMVLLKTRLLFITIDRLAKRAGIELETEINATFGRQQRANVNSAWNSEVASEKCIWALETWLAAKSDTEKSENHSVIEGIYALEYRRQMEPINTRIPRWVNHLLVFGLLLGCLSTIVGYVGCFYLIQHSESSTGPLLWLVLEAFLSVIRILVWVINPSWDDSTGIVFELQLASHALVITCNKFQDDIKNDGLAPLTRSNRFIEEVVAYTGPFPIFTVDDVALYYILAAEGRSESRNDKTPCCGVLYIVLSDHKEQTSRIVYKTAPENRFSVHVSSLHPVPRSTAINVKIDFSEEETQTEAHFLTSDPLFMAQLGAHYDEVNRKIHVAGSNKERKAFFGKTWAMERPSEDKNGNNGERPVIKLTEGDLAYLHQGQVEHRWRDMYLQLEEWVGFFISLYTKELFEDMPTEPVFKNDESMTIVQNYGANEAELLLIECQSILELLLISTAGKWDTYVMEGHKQMVQNILKDSFQAEQDAGANRKPHIEETRKARMRIRLHNELESLLEKERQTRRDSRQRRLIAQMELARERIQRRKYTNATGETIMGKWKALSSKAENGSVESDGASIINTIASRQAEFEGSMDARYRIAEAEMEVNNHRDGIEIESSNQPDRVAQLKARCHQRACQLFSRLKAQEDEFNDLHTNNVLIADTHSLVDYWSNKSLQERRRLQDRTQKYLKLTDASIKAVGGQGNMLRALMRSQEFSFIDIYETKLMTGKEITSVVKSVKSVAGVALSESQDDPEIYNAVEANVQAAVEVQSRDMCLYANVVVTDHYRTGKPYLLFAIQGESYCNAYFYTQEKCNHTVTLRHCMTKSNGKVNILLNGQELLGSWGRIQAVQADQFNHDFIDEDILLPNDYLRDEGQPNVLKIILDDDSGGVYWLSDVFLPVQPVHTGGSIYAG